MKRILIVDAQGGGIGKQLIASIKNKRQDALIVAVGTNSMATSQMLKAGADEAATGENSVVVMAKKADIIAGPLGIVIADSMLGEITPKMAVAIGQSGAMRVLIPMNQCSNSVVGLGGANLKKLIDEATEKIVSMLGDCD